MTRRPWTPREVAILRRHYPDKPTAWVAERVGRSVANVYAKADHLGVRKTAAYLAGVNSGRIQRGRQHPNMIASQFKPGMTPWNKGTHWVAGGRSAETRFKKGMRSVRWDVEAYALGALRVTTDGTLLIKATPGQGRHTWQIMARFCWEQAHGAIPPGHVIRARNGDQHDTRIENLEMLTRAENQRRNSLWTKYPKDVARLVQLKGAITRQVNRIAKENQK